MKKALVIVNKRAGQGGKASIEEELIHELNAQNHEVMIKYTPEGGAGTLIHDFAANKDLIVIAGGDGTISEVVRTLHKEGLKIPIAIIPMGTVNDFARVHGIPRNVKNAIGGLGDGVPESTDIIRVNGDHASYLVALGAFMTAFAEVDAGTKNKIGRLAYLFAGIRMLLKLKKYAVTVKTRETVVQTDSVLTLVSKQRSVGSLGRLIKNAEVDDGLLHIINIEPVNVFEALHIVCLALAGDITTHKKVAYMISDEVEIEATGLEYMNIDGDIHDYEELTISVAHGALSLLKPRSSENS